MHPKRVYAIVHLFIVMVLIALFFYGLELFFRWLYDKDSFFIAIFKIITTGSPE